MCRVRSLAWSLVSLELHKPPVGITPERFVDAATGQPLLPRLQHIFLGAHKALLVMKTTDADDRLRSTTLLVRAYSKHLRCLVLHTMTGHTCWPLLEEVYGCKELRRCELTLDAHKRTRTGEEDYPAMLAELRPVTSPPPLSPLPHLHTLQLQPPLGAGELRRVLEAAPGLRLLDVGQVKSLDALQVARLIADHCSPGLRSLCVSSAATRTAKPTPPRSAVSALSTPPFPALATFMCPLDWTSASLQSLVELLRQAPLHYLFLYNAPTPLLHHLAPLQHLHSLLTFANVAEGDAAMPDDVRRCFQESPHGGGLLSQLRGGQAEFERRLLGEPLKHQLISDETEETDEEFFLTRCITDFLPGARHCFVQERIFEGGRNGREAYMEELRSCFEEVRPREAGREKHKKKEKQRGRG